MYVIFKSMSFLHVLSYSLFFQQPEQMSPTEDQGKSSIPL